MVFGTRASLWPMMSIIWCVVVHLRPEKAFFSNKVRISGLGVRGLFDSDEVGVGRLVRQWWRIVDVRQSYWDAIGRSGRIQPVGRDATKVQMLQRDCHGPL